MAIILSPRPPAANRHRDAGPPAGGLRGKRVGIRRDNFWRSWDWITDEWARMLEAEGATPVIWRAPVGKGQQEAEIASAEYRQFVGSIDVAIVGLCNCGSCTLWAVTDGLGALERDIPTVVVSTKHFERLARALAEKSGRADLRVQLVPYPLEGRLEDDVRQIAREHFAPMLERLGAVRDGVKVAAE